MCRIDDTDSAPEFVIKVVEEGLKDLVLRDKTAKGKPKFRKYLNCIIICMLSLVYVIYRKFRKYGTCPIMVHPLFPGDL